MKILDCTLRDGGYYNDWDFDHSRAKELIIALNEAGVDIIEVGYKSCDKKSYGGLFKYCNESLLSYLKDYPDAEYAFMIDLKEFLNDNGTLNYEELNGVVKSEMDSVFSWVRIASHYNTVESVPDTIQFFKEKGYQICFNLMGGSLLSDTQILKAIDLVNPNPPQVFYIADSFGSFYPDDIKRLIALIKKSFNGKVGIHTHDNQGMAFANTLAAIDAGVDFVDGTVTGMGRGAGNLAIEQFLQKYSMEERGKHLRPNALLDIINNYINPLKSQYGWGFNYAYMLSGLKNIHPTYCQNLSDGNRYSIEQISNILEKIPVENRAKYNKNILDRAIKELLEDHESEEGNVSLNSGYILNADQVLILAGGASTKFLKEALNVLAIKEGIVVIDCNNSAPQIRAAHRIVSILNEVKLNHFLQQSKEDTPVVLTGQSSVSEKYVYEDLYYQPVEIGRLSYEGNLIKIPDYDAGLFSIALAAKCGAKRIYLAGFDGFEDQERNSTVDGFLKQIDEVLSGDGIELLSVTPTKYKSIKQTSVYTLI